MKKTWELNLNSWGTWVGSDFDVCNFHLRKYWYLGRVRTIYITLSNRPAKGSYRATLKDTYIHLSGWLTESTFAQDDLIERFIEAYGKCYVYVDIETYS